MISVTCKRLLHKNRISSKRALLRALEMLDIGRYPVENSENFLTISISEPFDGFCYKLAAAIITVSNRNTSQRMDKLFTIGHSNHQEARFIELLEMHDITALCDVRSSPYSRYNPQYNRELLQSALKRRGIAYVFLGSELGPRSDDPACYVDGKVQYSRLAATEIFRSGIERLWAGMKKYRVAIMCAEKDPITCHRMILICRALRKEPIEIEHILEDGSLEGLRHSEQRMLLELRLPQLRLFENPESLIQRAYDTQGERIAFVRTEGEQDREEESEGDA